MICPKPTVSSPVQTLANPYWQLEIVPANSALFSMCAATAAPWWKTLNEAGSASSTARSMREGTTLKVS